MTSFFRIAIVSLSIVLLAGVYTPVTAGIAEHVIVISVDGGGSGYIQNLIDLNMLPNFKRFQTQGAWTNNARNDYDYTITLPNHVTMITGLGVLDISNNGHLWISNVDPSNTPSATTYSIQNNKGSYVASVFDVVHDNGLRTALYATKTKFSLFDHSCNNGNGAPDITGPDNGNNKIDLYSYNQNSLALTNYFTTDMANTPSNYVMIHYTDSDTAGHASGWGSVAYNNALVAVDGYLELIFDLVSTDSALQGKTNIILTADHGGNGKDHSNKVDPLNYAIPFYVWGPDTGTAMDLYTSNQTTRLNPLAGRPAYTDSIQPIRNGDSSNLALRILGLAAIPGSTINSLQNLKIHSAEPIPGLCGSAHGQILTEPPIAGLCVSGAPSAVAGSGPWSWKCIGEYFGSNENCLADIKKWDISVSISGTGSGKVTSSPTCISCTFGTCYNSFTHGSTVTLLQTPNEISTFTGWSGDCSGTGACELAMNSTKAVTAIFNAAPKARVAAKPFSTLQGAYDDTATVNNAVIRLLEGDLTGAFTAGRKIAVTIEGGYNAAYTDINTETTVQGRMAIKTGTVRIKGTKVR